MSTLTASVELRSDHCIHKLPTSCRLTALPICCACQDKRPHASSYRKYIDGVGFVSQGTRQERYCWQFFWDNRVFASGIRQSESKIPDRPDQTIFLSRWYDWHRGFRIIRHEDGRVERQAVVGERLADAEPGCLPRTTHELRNGLPAEGERDVPDAESTNLQLANRNQGNSDFDLAAVPEEDRLFDFEAMPARDTESVDRTTAPTHQQPLHRQESSAPNLGSNVREAGTLEGNHPDVTRDIQNTNSATQQQLRSRIRDLRQAAYDTQSEALRILSELLPIQERHGLTWELQRNIRALDRNIHDFQQALLQLFPPLSGDARHSSGRTGVMNQQPTEHGTLFNSAQLDTQSRPQARAEPHNQPFNPGLSWSHRQTYPNAPPLSAASNQNQNAIEESEAQAEVVRAREDYHRMISESPVMTDEEYRIFEHARGRIRRAERRLFRARNDQRRAGVLGTREDVQSEGFTSDITTMFSRYREQYQMREATRNSQNSQHGVTDGAQGFSSPDGSASSALSDTQLMGLGALMARNASPAAQTQSGGYNMHARSFETPAETGAHSFDGPGPGQSVQRLFAEHNATNSGTSSVLGSQSPHEHEPHWQRPSPHNVDVHTSSNRTSPFPQNNQGSHGNGNESAIYSYSDLSSRFDAPDPHISFAHSRSRRAELYGAHSSPQQYSFVHGPIAGPPGLIQQHPLPASQGPGGSNQGHQPGPSRRAPANLTRMARSDMSDMIIEQIRLEAMNGSLPPEFGGGHALGRDRRRTAVPEDPNVPVGLDRLGTDRPSTEITEDNKWMRMECKICYSQIANVVLLPCGHCVMCRWCADEAYASHSADATIIMDRTKKCPVCRSKARSKHMIYGPEQEGKRKAKGKNKEREKKDEENQGDPDGHGDEGGSSNGAAPMAA